MNNTTSKQVRRRDFGAPEWIWEILIVVTITPGLVYGLLSITSLPVA